MKDIFPTPCFLLKTLLCILCITFVTTEKICATAVSTFDSAGTPISIEEEIKKAPEEYIREMGTYLRQGKLDTIGYLSKNFSRSPENDPRAPALFSIYFASRGDVEAAKKHLKNARAAGESPYSLYAQAMILRLEKKYQQAENICKKAISMDQSHPYPWNVLGRIQYDTGSTKKAYASFQKAVELQPDFLPGHINLGASAFTLGENQASIKHFKQALQIDHQAAKAHFGLGIVYAEAGRAGQAAEQFERTLELDSNNRSALQKLGHAQIQAHLYEKALKTGKKMEEQDIPDAPLILANAALHTGEPQNAVSHLEASSLEQPKARTLLGFSYMVQNQYQKSLACMEQALQTDPDDFGAFLARAALKLILGREIEMDTDLKNGWGEALDKAVYFSRGCVLASKNEWTAAAENWENAESLIPGFSASGLDAQTLEEGMAAKEAPHLNLGALYYYKNLFDPAFHQFSKALKKNEDSVFANYWAAQIMLKRNERDKAIAYLESSLNKAPRFFSALYATAELQLLAGNAEKSAGYYRRAAEVKKDPGVLLKLGLFHEDADQISKAADYYQQLIDQAPQFYVGYNQLAWLYAKRGIKLEKALDLAHKAISLRPGNASVLDTLGWIHYNKKEYDKALDYLKQSKRVNPKNPTVIYHLGLTYHALGEKSKARRLLKNALKINDQFEGAEKAKKILDEKIEL